MADIILTNVLNEKISIEELLKWLTADNNEETIWPDIGQYGSTRTDFISYFLNYLREQCKSISPEIKEIQEKPAKKGYPGEHGDAPSPKSKEFVARNPGPASHSHQKQDPYVDYKTRNAGRQILQQRSEPFFSPVSPDRPDVSNQQSPMPRGHFPPLLHQRGSDSPLSDNAISRIAQLNIQPGNSGNLPFSQNQLPANRNDDNVSQYPNNSGEKKYSADASSPCNSLSGNFNTSIDKAQMQMGNLCVSSSSEIFNNSLLNAASDSPRRFENSKKNASIVNSSSSCFSPISPLYANSTSILCPRRVERSHNETRNSHDNSLNSSNPSRTSTPKSVSGSGHKVLKSGQNPNVCLGDFMNSEGKGSKKKNHKQRRTELYKQSQERKVMTSETNSMNPKSWNETELKSAKSTRRIKPTRLNVSGEKESRETQVFGVISRPTTANPNFVEAPSTDKTQEELSFEIERGLLKLERQRQPRNETTIEVPETKLPSKVHSTIVPQLDLVSNVEKLNSLARLYSGILERNLMPNPMTEIYFLITLLTTQYKVLPVEMKNLTDKSAAYESSVKILDTLDLGCTVLSDDISTEMTNDESRESSNAEDTRNDPDDNSIDKCENHSAKYLDTAHNCVYFAITVMLNQQYLLSILDRATLKLLCENHQIAAFKPELQKYLNDIYAVKCLQTNRVKQTGNSQTNVCFQVDTDNRETFPSSVAFTLFRKQRDLFYDILKDWEENHLKPDWSFQRALKNKINSLLALHTDAVNYCHFAKLFTSQLLVSSGQSGKTEDPMSDDSLSFLKSLKHLNPEKLIQLKGRLVTPLTSTGPVPEPVFPGVEEFYKEFILNASNWKFYVILENTFISEIMELNDAQFARSEIEATETTVDESTKQYFITCVSSLRLLAKFTSFTQTLPFKSAAESPEWLLSQVQLRGLVQPSLDLRTCLLDALTHRRLSLTVPWIVQYMAMLDTVTLRLPYYVNIGELLYCIYRITNHRYPFVSNDFTMSSQTSSLMMFTIGWLFELPNFPRDLYAQWQINYGTKKLRIHDCSKDARKKYLNTIGIDEKSSKDDFVKYNPTLDELEIIDDRALYECCPFLTELRILLISGNATLSSGNANRHITPVSSQLSAPNFGAKTKNLQTQLEEAFFHGQPSSIRKTVDFVSERVASSCVKYICNVIIPISKQRNMMDFIKSKNGKIDLLQKEEDPEEKSQTSPSESPNKPGRKPQTELAERQMQALATTIKDDVKRECVKKIAEMCEKRTIKSIESLLADDVFPSVKETCTAITRRTAIERVEQWIDLHIVESLFLKNMTIELKKLLKDGSVDLADKENRHNTEVSSPTEVIEMLRNSMWELLERKNRWAQLSVDSIAKTLECLRQTLTERADLVEYPERNLYTMSVEYSLLLITHRQDLFTPDIQVKFVKVWKMNNSRVGEKEGLFTRIMSSRNIRMLTSTSDKSVMRVFGRLLKELLRENLLSIEALSEQCVALFRQEWPEPILKQLSQCLKDVVVGYKCSGSHPEGILLGWIATTCDEMEICDYD